MSPGERAGVFLDRDGTLLDELGYLARPEDLRLLPGAAAAVRELNEAGLAVVLVTNQSGIARGLFDEEALARVHARLAEELAQAGAHMDLVLYCPHHPTEGEPPYRVQCECRKPRPGLLFEAQARLGLALAKSWAVGDAARDLEAARRAGVQRRVLVSTGKGEETRRSLSASESESEGLYFARDIAEAARLILGELAEPQGR